VIREFADADTDAIVETWYAASKLATPFLDEEFLDGERDNIRDVWLKKAETWVYEDDGEVAGFISLIGNEVGGIFVRPAAQGKGIGRALMDHAAGIRDCLVLDVFEDNAIGRRFYDRYGFRLVRRHVHEETGHSLLRLTTGD